MKWFLLLLPLLPPAERAWAQAGAQMRRAGRADKEASAARPQKEKVEKSKAAAEKKPAAKPEQEASAETFTFTDDVKAVAFSPDGRFAAARGPDGGPDRIKIWDMRDKRMHLVLEAGWSGTADTLAFSPDGDTLASGEGSDVSFWDLETGSRWRRFEDRSPSSGPVAFSPDTKYFTAIMGTRLLIWPLEQKRRKEENAALSWPDASQLRALSFSPDSAKLAAIGFRSPQRTRGQVEVLNPADGSVLKTLQDAEVGFFCGGFSRNGMVLGAAGIRPTTEGPRAEFVFWRVSDWKMILRIRTEIKGEVLGMAFSPDGLFMAAVIGGYKGMPVFDLRTGKQIRSVPGVAVERRGAVAVSADGNQVMATGHKEVLFWTADAVFGGRAPAPRKRR